MTNKEPAYVNYVSLETQQGDLSPYRIANLVINRPHQANAFDGETLIRVTQLLEEIKQEKGIRLVLFQAEGANFTGGADLKWMLASSKMNHHDNVEEATKLTTMFETLSHMEVPTAALVKGASYGIGVGIVACCDFAIAEDTATFSLNEARLGLIPAVVLPYINRKADCGQLRRHVLGGRTFSADEAKEFGILQVVAPKSDIEHITRGEVNQLLLSSPEAQASYKRLQKYLGNNSYQQGPYTAAAIAIARASDFGQIGLRSYLQNEPAPWVCQVPETSPLVV